ncbi:hypothetical protein [Cystobacter fuscus]|uniref:hypothetical protein n=1 Tax=Cystobacter fuscus TaxID=43 RepID=UPI002B29BDC2|nr:hypothetical protein F0U63_32415 [Cystobacter fuscus]
MTMFRLLAALAALLLVPAAARADEGGCSRWLSPALAEGPVALGFLSADVSTGRRTCPRTEVGLGIQGNAIIETHNLYGAVTGSGVVSGSVAVRPDLEVFATLEAPRIQYVQNASLTGTDVALGQLTAGATWAVLSRGAFVLAPSVRLQLPTSFASPRTRTAGAEVGAALLYRPTERFDVHGYAGVDGDLGLGAAASLPRAGVLVNVGVEYIVCRPFAVVLDANARFGRRAVLDSVAPTLGVRFSAGEHFGAELGASLPVLGAERALAAGGLKFTWRL